MHALAPLLLVAILFKHRQLREDTLYRANAFFLVGFYYFFWLQYNIYWFRIFPSSSLLQFLPSILFTLFVVGIALSRWNQKSHPLKTALFGTLFAVSLLASFGFDTQVKEKLAELGGFYKGESFYPVNKPEDETTISITLANIGLTTSVPEHWVQHPLESGHSYFTSANNGVTQLEVRPNCLGRLALDIPTYVSNTEQSFQLEQASSEISHECIVADEGKHCIVKANYGNGRKPAEKWRWFFKPLSGDRSVNIDVLFYSPEVELRERAMRVLQATHTTGEKPQWCTTPADWI